MPVLHPLQSVSGLKCKHVNSQLELEKGMCQRSLGPFVCQSHSPSQQCPPPLTQDKPRCGGFLSCMTLVQVSLEKLMRRRMETRTWHEVNLWCLLRSKKQMVFQTGFIFFSFLCNIQIEIS